MNKYKDKSFFELALRFGAMFLVLVSIIKIVMGIFNTGSIDGMIELYFGVDTFMPFAITQLVMSAIYGLFMAGYYKFIKK